jgi:transketolase
MRPTALQWSHKREKDVNKAEKIKNALQETKERRKGQRPVVFQLKLQNLSKKKELDLRGLHLHR